MRSRRCLALVALGSAGLLPSPAVATEGNLYGFGSSIWATSHQFTATVLAGAVWQIQAPALNPALVGNHFEMNWGCPVTGSEIAAVQWSALRTQAPSSLALQVTGDRRPLWSEADGAAPQSPQGGRAYDVRLPGGNCNVHLALHQVEARTQHARGYFIDNPRILVRDLTAPAVSGLTLPTGWLTTSAMLRVGWSVSDNFGADGVGAQRVLLGGQTRWSGPPGVGAQTADLSLAGLGDGVREVAVQVDGDGTDDAAQTGSIWIDGTAPTAAGITSSLSGEPGSAALSWTAADNLSGVASSRPEINTNADGRTSGTWSPLATIGGGGEKTLAARGLPVGDGVHAWRVRATDVAGNTALTTAAGSVVVDTTPPRVDVHSVPLGWVNRADVDLTATDNLQTVLGVGPTEIEVNAASDGSESGEWLRRATFASPPGRHVVPVDLTGLENGRHAVRITLRNGGPFGKTLSTEKRATLRVDLTPPTIPRASFSPGGARPMTVAWVSEDAHSGVATVTIQWKDGSAWRTLASEKAADGSGSMAIDVSALADGERTLRLVIADAAGNTASRTGTATITGNRTGGTTGDPLGRLRDANLTVTITRAQRDRRGGRAVLVTTVATGTGVRISGRLVDREGRGIVGAEIQVRDQRGRLIGRGLARRGGRFVVEARPVGGGLLRVGVAVGSRLLPRRTGTDLWVAVRPLVAFGASSTTAAAGESVLFSGRLRPSPADLGLGSRKGVVLEWLDPIRRIWRPVVNARIRADGTFAIPWTFGLGGLTIPMRVVVPAEVGWPLLPARSPVIRMVVR